MGKTTTIETFDSSWNPITGCRHECVFCYAKRIADRFAGYVQDDENRHKYSITGYKGRNIYTVESPMTKQTKSGEIQTAVYPFGFEPTFYPYKLNEPQSWKEPKNIFVCSMSDLFGEWTPDEWIQKVFDACDKAPQHRYFFLTKNPMRYTYLKESGKLPKRDNFWYGTTITNKTGEFFAPYFKDGYHCFLSIEPIQENIFTGWEHRDLVGNSIEWIIVGAETGNRVGKVRPKKEWILKIAEVCENANIPLFMKDSLQKQMGDDFKQEFPWQN